MEIGLVGLAPLKLCEGEQAGEKPRLTRSGFRANHCMLFYCSLSSIFFTSSFTEPFFTFGST